MNIITNLTWLNVPHLAFFESPCPLNFTLVGSYITLNIINTILVRTPCSKSRHSKANIKYHQTMQASQWNSSVLGLVLSSAALSSRHSPPETPFHDFQHLSALDSMSLVSDAWNACLMRISADFTWPLSMLTSTHCFRLEPAEKRQKGLPFRLSNRCPMLARPQLLEKQRILARSAVAWLQWSAGMEPRSVITRDHMYVHIDYIDYTTTIHCYAYIYIL